ncbi:MAG: tetratricopeptide repeat protein [Flavobacteriaceae bacterium]|nr:tetratricopeptide repeat protein [Flavobacteriaceae bacterium]
MYSKSWIISIVFLCLFLRLNAQEYVDEKYYLLDSLDLSLTSSKEKNLLESSLKKYHSASQDTLKLKAISHLVENSWDNKIWPRYNAWVYLFTKENLGDLIDTYYQIELSPVDRQLLLYYANAVNNFGIIQSEIGDLPKALEYYFVSLGIREHIKDNIGISETYNNIGAVYSTLDNTEKSLENYEKAKTIAEKVGDNDLMAVVLSNIGILYKETGKTEEALQCYERSLVIKKELNDNKGYGLTLGLIGEIHEDEGELKKALNFYKRSLVIFENEKDNDGIAVSLNRIGTIYFKQNITIKAKESALEAISLAKESSDEAIVMNSSLLLSSIYEREKLWKKAFEFQKLHVKMRDRVKSIEIQKKTAETQIKYDLSSQQQKIDFLSFKNKTQEARLKTNKVSIILISIALAIVTILVLGYRKSNKKKQLINELLERENDTKKTILQEIHHRIKNNLQVVNSLLRMQASKTKDKDIKIAFKETQSRVVSMAKLHEKMYQSGDFKNLNAKEYISHLVEDIVKNYTVDKKVSLKLDIEEVFFDSKIMMPLSLIINEVITNSLKYAFNNEENPIITVTLKQLSTIKNELHIADNGTGYDREKESKGLGAKLINSFTQQISGTIHHNTINGTSVTITFSRLV